MLFLDLRGFYLFLIVEAVVEDAFGFLFTAGQRLHKTGDVNEHIGPVVDIRLSRRDNDGLARRAGRHALRA